MSFDRLFALRPSGRLLNHGIVIDQVLAVKSDTDVSGLPLRPRF